MSEGSLLRLPPTASKIPDTTSIVGDEAASDSAQKKRRPTGLVDEVTVTSSSSAVVQDALRPMSDVEARATITGHGQLLERLIRALVQGGREAGQAPTLVAKLTRALPEVMRATESVPEAGADLGPRLDALLALLGRGPPEGPTKALTDALGKLRGSVEATREDFFPIVSRSLRYDTGRWPVTGTPTEMDSVRVSNELAGLFPFLRPKGLHDILEHVLDNVANYGVEGHTASGTLACGVRDGSVVIRVSNPLHAQDLPRTLRDRLFTPADGVLVIPKEERDAETGGGFGIRAITNALPHVYHPLVKATTQATVGWRQIGAANNGGTVVFELSIPIPSHGEQAELLAKTQRQAALKQAKDQAEVVLAKPPVGRGVAGYVERLRQVLQQAIPAYHDAPDLLDGLWIHRVFDGLAALGTQAAAAAPELRRCMLEDCSAFPAAKALPQIEGPEDRKETLRVFGEFLASHGEQAPIGYSVESIASYVQDATSAQALLPGLSKMLERGSAMHRIAKALAEWAPDAVDEALLTRLLTGAAGTAGRPEERQAVALELIAARSSLSEANADLLVPLLVGPHGHRAQEALTGKSLGPTAVPMLVEILNRAQDTKTKLYHLGQAVQGMEPKHLQALIPPLFLLLTTKDDSYSAQQMLAHIGLGPEQVPLLGQALETVAAAGNSIYGIGELIKGMSCDRQALKPILKKLVGVQEHNYVAKQLLEQIGSG